MVAFVLVGFTFSRVSESIELTTGVSPLSSLMAAAVIAFILVKRGERTAPRSMVGAAAALSALYLAVLAFSAIGARDQGRSLAEIDSQLRGIVIAGAVVLAVTSPRRLRLALWGIVTATLVVAAPNYWQAISASHQSDFHGLARGVYAALDSQTGWRLGGPMGDPNYFAQMLAVGVVVSIERAAHSAGWPRMVALAATGSGVGALLFTYSRGGLVALVVAVTVLSLRLLSWRTVAVALLAGFVLVAATPNALLGRVRSAATSAPAALSGDLVRDTAINGRASELLVGFEEFSDHPLLGVGTGNYSVHYLVYAGRLGLDSRDEARSAHSLVIETLAETGIVGLAALGAMVLLAFASIGSLRAYGRAAGDGRQLFGLAVAVEAAFVGHLMSALFLHSAYPRGFWLLLGLALASRQVVRQPSAVAPAAATPH